jgi:hypothetical protein
MPSPATAIALAALVVALGGTAFAASDRLLTGADIRNNSLTGADIRNASLTGADIRRGSLQAFHLSPRARASLRGASGSQGAPGPQGPAGDDASLADVPAGGALTGTYPSPGLAAGSVDGSAVADGGLSLADLVRSPQTAITVASGPIASHSCVNLASVSGVPAGSLVIQTVVSGTLPPGVELPVYVAQGGGMDLRICNRSADLVGVTNLTWRASYIPPGP